MKSQPDLRAKVSAALACLMLGWTSALHGCSGSSQARYGERVDKTADKAVHGVHSQRLAELMQGLERMRSERLPQAMDPQIEERRRIEVISRVARSVALSAEQIPAAASTASLDANSREEFLRLAETLGRRAQQIAENAEDPEATSIDELRTQIEAMEAICDRCHDRFRISRDST
jgi:cytochrome c556